MNGWNTPPYVEHVMKEGEATPRQIEMALARQAIRDSTVGHRRWTFGWLRGPGRFFASIWARRPRARSVEP